MLQDLVKEDEPICSKCKGDGVIPLDEKDYQTCHWYSCSNCLGKVDWISNVAKRYEMIFGVWYPYSVLQEMISDAKGRRISNSRKNRKERDDSERFSKRSFD